MFETSAITNRSCSGPIKAAASGISGRAECVEIRTAIFLCLIVALNFNIELLFIYYHLIYLFVCFALHAVSLARGKKTGTGQFLSEWACSRGKEAARCSQFFLGGEISPEIWKPLPLGAWARHVVLEGFNATISCPLWALLGIFPHPWISEGSFGNRTSSSLPTAPFLSFPSLQVGLSVGSLHAWAANWGPAAAVQLQAGPILYSFSLEICSFFWIVELFLPTKRRENSNLFSVVHKRKPLSPWQDFSGESVNNLLEPNPLGGSLKLPAWFNL